MDFRRFLLDAHALAHTESSTESTIPSNEWPKSGPPWTMIADEKLQETLPDHSSAAWLLWHTARTEDMGVNTIVRGAPEVFDRDGWSARLGVELRHVGSGMSESDATALSASLNVGALREYRDAVGRETQDWLRNGNLAVLDQPINEAADRLLPTQDFIEPIMDWATIYFPGRTGGWFFARLALWHNFFHLGQMEHVLGLVGVSEWDRARAFYGRSFHFP